MTFSYIWWIFFQCTMVFLFISKYQKHNKIPSTLKVYLFIAVFLEPKTELANDKYLLFVSGYQIKIWKSISSAAEKWTDTDKSIGVRVNIFHVSKYTCVIQKSWLPIYCSSCSSWSCVWLWFQHNLSLQVASPSILFPLPELYVSCLSPVRISGKFILVWTFHSHLLTMKGQKPTAWWEWDKTKEESGSHDVTSELPK